MARTRKAVTYWAQHLAVVRQGKQPPPTKHELFDLHIQRKQRWHTRHAPRGAIPHGQAESPTHVKPAPCWIHCHSADRSIDAPAEGTPRYARYVERDDKARRAAMTFAGPLRHGMA